MTSPYGISAPGSSWHLIVSAAGEAVTARVYNPQSLNGSRADTRRGVLVLDLRLRDLAGLSPIDLAFALSSATCDAIVTYHLRPQAPAPPDRGHGAEQVKGQLRIDLPC